MSAKDRERAKKYAAQGRPSATQEAKAKTTARAERKRGSAPDPLEQLSNFDPSNPVPIPRSADSRTRGEKHQRSTRPSWS